MNRILEHWIENMPKLDEKVLGALAYIGGRAWGGLFAPAIYVWLLWSAWDAPDMTSKWRWLFSALGLLLLAACLFYPTAFRSYMRMLLNKGRVVSALLGDVREKQGKGQEITLADLRAINDALVELLRKVN